MQRQDVVLIDSPVANMANIARALTGAGAVVSLRSDPDSIAKAAKLVLPGVGSFGAAMKWLGESGVADSLRSAVSRGAWLLGICVGHQALFEHSEEDGGFAGLGLLPGSVRRFGGLLPVPQIGWNRVLATSHPLFEGITPGTPFYFANSYRVENADGEIAACDYGGRFVAAVARSRVVGVQFHPEKSSRAGLRLLRNFVELA
jgi:glutamine amidotransferase